MDDFLRRTRLERILDRATDEVRKWPAWKISEEIRGEFSAKPQFDASRKPISLNEIEMIRAFLQRLFGGASAAEIAPDVKSAVSHAVEVARDLGDVTSDTYALLVSKAMALKHAIPTISAANLKSSLASFVKIAPLGVPLSKFAIGAGLTFGLYKLYKMLKRKFSKDIDRLTQKNEELLDEGLITDIFKGLFAKIIGKAEEDEEIRQALDQAAAEELEGSDLEESLEEQGDLSRLLRALREASS